MTLEQAIFGLFAIPIWVYIWIVFFNFIFFDNKNTYRKKRKQK